MTPTRLLAVAATVLLAAPAAADAAGIRASLRVETSQRTLVGPDGARVGATRSYLDTDGTAHALPANTALGQLVAGTGAAGVDLGVSFNAQFGGFVAAIGGQDAGTNGFWAFYVDNVASSTGAETTFLARKPEYVWVLDSDFNKPGPFFLDLDVASRGPHSVTFRVTRAGGKRPAAARGATLTINGQRIAIPASGRLTIEAHGTWTARASLAGTISSEILAGSS